MANEKQIKNLTVTELKKQNKALDAKTEHTIVVGDSKYKIKVDNTFRKTKQHEVLQDMIDFLNEGHKRNEILEVATTYTSLLLIKHFTSLEIPNNIDDAIVMLNVLIDLDILNDIIDLLPEDEVEKMYNSLNASVSRMNENIKELREEADEISEKIENSEVKELLTDGEE